MAEAFVRGFDFGRVFARTFSTLFGAFPQFFGIALIVQIPAMVVIVLVVIATPELVAVEATGQGPADLPIAAIMRVVAVVAVMFVLSLVLVQAATANGAINHLRGGRVLVWRSVGLVVRRGLPLAGVTLVQIVVLYGVVLLSVPFYFIPEVGVWIGAAATVCAVVFAVYLYLRWWVAIPAVVVENIGVFDALSRSARLTAGRKWTVLGLLAVLWLCAFTANVVIPLPFELIPGSALDSVVGLAVNVSTAALIAIAAGIGYHDLRVEKDGVPAEQIATVFD